MTTEILEHAADVPSTEMAVHSANVMAKFSNGEAYNEAVWIERGRFAVRQTMEGMFELGRALIVIKEHTPHGRFAEIAEKEFGLGRRESQRLMNATLRFIDPKMKQAQPKLMTLGKSKLLELLVEEDENESIGKKICEAIAVKIPTQIIVGPKDKQARVVSVHYEIGRASCRERV